MLYIMCLLHKRTFLWTDTQVPVYVHAQVRMCPCALTHTQTHTTYKYTHTAQTQTHTHTIHTCISGPEVAIALMVSEQMACTMLLNFSVSMVAISQAFVISSSFCSLTYLVSASLALVNLSNSDCYK